MHIVKGSEKLRLRKEAGEMRRNTKSKTADEREKKSAERRGRALCAVGLPADADCRMPVITVTGGRYVKVEHHRGALLLTDACVRLYSCMGIIRIEGQKLLASRMDDDVMLLEGQVRSVSIE